MMRMEEYDHLAEVSYVIRIREGEYRVTSNPDLAEWYKEAGHRVNTLINADDFNTVRTETLVRAAIVLFGVTLLGIGYLAYRWIIA